MTWIKRTLPPESPEIAQRLDSISKAYPAEYDQAKRHLRQTPTIVNDDSIMLSHSLIPDAMEHMFRGYAAMLAPDLPLTRRQQEMIATTVAALNRCFY
ncbi:MAG TPA: hypothetical protein VN947_27270 [Polyangia bacterium]|nr:hypothetical protein [Polyangia bacterium]